MAKLEEISDLELTLELIRRLELELCSDKYRNTTIGDKDFHKMRIMYKAHVELVCLKYIFLRESDDVNKDKLHEQFMKELYG